MRARFPDRFYLEATRTHRPNEDVFLDGALALGETLDLPIVATQRRALPDARRFRGARSARLHPRGPRARRSEAPARLFARAVSEVAGRDGGAVRRSAGADRELGRARQALQSRAQLRQVFPAGVSGAGRAHARQLHPRRARAPASTIGSPSIRPRPASRARTTTSASRSSSTSSCRWGSPATS